MAGNPGSAPPTKATDGAPAPRLDPAEAKKMVRQSWRQTFPKGAVTTVLEMRAEGCQRTEVFADERRAGVYVCHRCATELYDSATKLVPEAASQDRKVFPEFSASKVEMHTKGDIAFGRRTTALRCPECGLFLGDLFEEKATGGERHCLYSLMLAFIDAETGSVTYGTDAPPTPEESGLPLGLIAAVGAVIALGAAAAAAYFWSSSSASSSTSNNDE